MKQVNTGHLTGWFNPSLSQGDSKGLTHTVVDTVPSHKVDQRPEDALCETKGCTTVSVNKVCAAPCDALWITLWGTHLQGASQGEQGCEFLRRTLCGTLWGTHLQGASQGYLVIVITGFSESPCEMGDSQGAQYLLNHPVQPLPHPVNHPVPLIDPTNTTYYIY